MSILRSSRAFMESVKNVSRLKYVADTRNVRAFCVVKDVEKTTTNPTTPVVEPVSHNIRLTSHKVNAFERYILVWGGKYKSVKDVPNHISQDVLERARNKARIKINILMGVVTLLACILMIYSGKKAVKQGESLSKENAEWHRQYNEQARAEEAKLKDLAK